MNNSNMASGPASGFKDYYGIFADQRNDLIQKIVSVFNLYGFGRLETPVIERIETLRGKGGNETEKLIYEVLDTSKDSKLGLRFDLTVPLARYISQNKGNMQFPFKRYAYGDVFRGEAPQMQKGRLRGFMQCDADCVGIKSDLIDSEIILLMLNVFKALDLQVTIRINNRGMLDSLIDLCKISDLDLVKKVFGIVDDIDKVGLDKSLSIAAGILNESQYGLLERYLSIDENSNINILNMLKELLGESQYFNEAYNNLKAVSELLASYPNVVIDPKIARGLDYYTGLIYEATIDEVKEVGTVSAGGRYDNLIESLGGPSLPAVGTSVGIDRLLVALEKLGRFDANKNNSQVFVCVFGTELMHESLKIAEIIRANGISTLLWTNPDTKISKQLSECSKLGIPYAIIIGSDEVEKGVVLVKDMNKQTQTSLKIEEFLKII